MLNFWERVRRLESMFKLFCLSISSALFLGLTACSPSFVEVVSETDEKQYQLAKNFQAQGRTEDALNAFLRVIDARRDAPESHLEVGNIYLDAFKDPISSIYHLKRYLQLKPDSPQAVQVQQLIQTAEKEFARQLPAGPYNAEIDRVEMLELLKALKIENGRLKQALAVSGQRLASYEGMLQGARRATAASELQTVQSLQVQVPRETIQAATPNPESVPRAYVIQSGDTLSKISKRFYGTPNRYQDIFQANRDRIKTPNALKVGQEIRIP